MGIFKIDHQRVLNDDHCAPGEDDIGREETSISGEDFVDCELAELGCERIMFQDQLLDIPYELYDLPDLRDILSLETWNSCLTEDERFMLSAYLPDMDQLAFWSTMTELLGGNDMFFDSPLTVFFRNLKGGFYNEKVTCYKDGLQFVEKIRFCHSLRSYHEDMIQTMSDMKKLWDPCGPSISINERIRNWKLWKNHNEGVLSLDLNAYPEDEILSCNEVIPITLKPPPRSSQMKLVPLNTSGKGILKIKRPGLNASQTSIPYPPPTDDVVLNLPPPKGVLKIVPKGPPRRQQEQPRAITMLSEIPGFTTSRLSSLPLTIHKWDERVYEESSLPFHKVGPQRVDCLDDNMGSGKSFHSSSRYVKPTKETSYDVITCLRQQSLFGSNSDSMSEGNGSTKNPLFVRRYPSERERHSRQLSPSRFDHDYPRGEQRIVPNGVSRQSEFHIRERQSAVTIGQQNGALLPKTYKRRKVEMDKSLDFVN